MKSTAVLLLLLSPAAAFAQSPFDGTWVIEENAQLPDKPVAFLLADGVWGMNSGVKADGRDHPVPEAAYSDTLNVEVLDDRTVEVISKKDGRVMFTEVDIVSPDGGTLTQIVKDTTEAETVTVTTVSKRVEKGPPGSHSISGSWQAYRFFRSKNGSTIRYRSTAEGFSAETPLGEKFEARFDGKDYPVEGDPGHTLASAKLISPRAVELTFRRSGKVVEVLHLTVEADGKSISVINENKESGGTTKYRMIKEN
jgi:hypothetical protein